MKSKTVQAFGFFTICCFFALAIVGCANLNKWHSSEGQQTEVGDKQSKPLMETASVDMKGTKVPPGQTHDDYLHAVRWQGETLAYISKWYTGQFKNWKVLAKANPALNPNRIYKGNQIVIPKGVLKTRKPLPKNFIAVLTPKTIKKSSVSSKKQEELPLFGPKEH